MPGVLAANSTARWFWCLAALHLIVWTGVPILTQSNAPLDTVEMLYWGREWQWGYYKHPPLPAWAAEAFATLPGDPVWPTYLLSQLCIVGCFWAAWRLGRELLRPWEALAAAIVMQSSVYYNCTTPEFNNNILAKVCWAMFVLCLYFGIARNRIAPWALAGVFLAAAFLSKYDAILLMLSMLTFSFVSARARACWRTPGPYVMTGISLLLIAPHLWWLVAHDFLTIRYALARSAAPPTWLNHVANPLEFFGAQLAAVGLVLLLATLALGWRWRWKQVDRDGQFQREFVSFVVLGPLVAALLASALTGAHLRSMWGASMFTYLGVLLFAWFEAKPGEVPVRRLIGVSVSVGLLFAVGLASRNLFGSKLQDHALRVDFPGQELAIEVEQIWNRHTAAPLENVAGDWWIAGNVGAYHADRPSILADLNGSISSWFDKHELQREGGVVLWNYDQVDADYEARLRDEYPAIEVLPPLEIPWDKTPLRAPLRIGVGVLEAEAVALPGVAENTAENTAERTPESAAKLQL